MRFSDQNHRFDLLLVLVELFQAIRQFSSVLDEKVDLFSQHSPNCKRKNVKLFNFHQKLTVKIIDGITVLDMLFESVSINRHVTGNKHVQQKPHILMTISPEGSML